MFIYRISTFNKRKFDFYIKNNKIIIKLMIIPKILIFYLQPFPIIFFLFTSLPIIYINYFLIIQLNDYILITHIHSSININLY